MLLEFACSNHKSIKDKVVFSALAGKDNTFENELIKFGSFRVLENAVIYGANGSGKSNLIDAVSFMKNLVLNSINLQPGQGILQQPHKMLDISTDSSYSIQFITKGVRYAYGFSINKSLVREEYLYYFPNCRQVKVFERQNNDFTAGDKFRGKFDTCKDVLKPNRLLLSCAANFSSVECIANAFSFFRDDLIIYKGFGTDNWMDYSLHKIHDDPHSKKIVLSLLNNLGTGIKDILITIDKKNMTASEMPPFLSDEFKALIAKQQIDAINAKVVYDQFTVDLFTEESTGIKKLFEFLCPMIDIIINGKVLICDEIETSFHESIICGLVGLFKSLCLDPPAQMFFTTHDTSILSLSLFRRDQIWFTELTKDCRATDLYSLAEIKNVRKDENVGRGYISGKYGAVPMLNDNLADVIAKMQGADNNG